MNEETNTIINNHNEVAADTVSQEVSAEVVDITPTTEVAPLAVTEVVEGDTTTA